MLLQFPHYLSFIKGIVDSNKAPTFKIMSMRTTTIVRNKILTWALKFMREVATALIWIF